MIRCHRRLVEGRVVATIVKKATQVTLMRAMQVIAAEGKSTKRTFVCKAFILIFDRRRDIKADDKGRNAHRPVARKPNSILRVDSSDSDSSDGIRRHGSRTERQRGDPRAKITNQQQPEGVDLANVKKEVELKEFQKICMRRRDLCKWIEHTDF